ncbi:MAG: UDP-3-O-(3-hydroxymyristoyl)glucosamine N-acyltransferase [Acidobacteria bacterium]|nr:UDP-3-O-(3-hydroxymyristoyl)glucosamine N-acyltransferase [Acidobacteriota bacterium]
MSPVYKEVELHELSKSFNLDLKGNPSTKISGVNDIRAAGSSEIAFLFSEKGIDIAVNSKAGALVLRPEWIDKRLENRNLLLTDNPKLAMARIHCYLLDKQPEREGVSKQAFIEQSANVDSTAVIYPFVYIGKNSVIGKNVIIYPNTHIGSEVKIGDGTTIHAGCSINNDTIIGKECIIHSGTVIGSDGYGFVKDRNHNYKVPQVGRVRIGDDCEFGANNTIDRATFGETVIGNNVKTDNLVHIAHNCQIGDHCLIIAMSGVAGSTVLGENVTIAGNSAVMDHLKIGDNAIIGSQTLVIKDVPDGQVFTGYPAVDHRTWLRMTTAQQKLPELVKRVAQLEKELSSIKGSGEGSK